MQTYTYCPSERPQDSLTIRKWGSWTVRAGGGHRWVVQAPDTQVEGGLLWPQSRFPVQSVCIKYAPLRPLQTKYIKIFTGPVPPVFFFSSYWTLLFIQVSFQLWYILKACVSASSVWFSFFSHLYLISPLYKYFPTNIVSPFSPYSRRNWQWVMNSK